MVTRIEIPYDFNDEDICVILGNYIDNSIEVAKNIQNNSRRIISLELIYRKTVWSL